MPPRLIVFDLDGTLIDSSLDLCNSVNAALAHVGKPSLPNALIATYIGDGAAMLVRRALGDPSDLDALDPQDPTTSDIFRRAFDHFLAWYREHKLDNTRAYPGVLSTLQTIRSLHPHIPMAVLTNKPVLPSRAICDALSLTPFFFQNYGGNSFPTKKPDPEGLLTLIAEANTLLQTHSASLNPRPWTLDPAQVLMIGDSDVDIRTARAIGARTIGCLYGLSPHSLQAANPDRLVATPAELLEAIFS